MLRNSKQFYPTTAWSCLFLDSKPISIMLIPSPLTATTEHSEGLFGDLFGDPFSTKIVSSDKSRFCLCGSLVLVFIIWSF